MIVDPSTGDARSSGTGLRTLRILPAVDHGRMHDRLKLTVDEFGVVESSATRTRLIRTDQDRGSGKMWSLSTKAAKMGPKPLATSPLMSTSQPIGKLLSDSASVLTSAVTVASPITRSRSLPGLR
jgi:hypothetical protein